MLSLMTESFVPTPSTVASLIPPSSVQVWKVPEIYGASVRVAASLREAFGRLRIPPIFSILTIDPFELSTAAPADRPSHGVSYDKARSTTTKGAQ